MLVTLKTLNPTKNGSSQDICTDRVQYIISVYNDNHLHIVIWYFDWDGRESKNQ